MYTIWHAAFISNYIDDIIAKHVLTCRMSLKNFLYYTDKVALKLADIAIYSIKLH